MSFASAHTGNNIGCCVVRVKDPQQANEECRRLGLMPQQCNHARGYLLRDEDFPQQGMELNRFYPTAEMKAKGFVVG